MAIRLQFASPCLKAWAWESDSKFQLCCFFICETFNKWYNYLSLICRMKIIIVPGHTQWNTTWFRCVAGAQYVGPKQARPSPLGWKRSGFRLSIDKTRNDGSNKLTQGFPGGSNEFQGWCRQLLYDRQSMKKVIKKINKMESEQAQLITLGGNLSGTTSRSNIQAFSSKINRISLLEWEIILGWMNCIAGYFFFDPTTRTVVRSMKYLNGCPIPHLFLFQTTLHKA